MTNPFPLIAALALALLTGCGGGLIPFTHEIRLQNGLTKDDLKNLQYYVSNKITLRRELTSDDKQVTASHKLLLLSGHTNEEVVVEEETPGVAVEVGDRDLSISFENGSSVVFAVGGERPSGPPSLDVAPAAEPNPFPGNPDGGGNKSEPEPFPGSSGGSSSLGGKYFVVVDRGGRIPFQGKLFTAVENSLQAHLLIDADRLERVVDNRKVLPGVRLPNR